LRQIFVLAGCLLLPLLVWAQQGGGQQGGQRGQGGFSPLVPPEIDLILANPLDNSLIVRDPPIEDPNAPPRLLVKAEWLEVVRVGTNNVVRRFRSHSSPETILTSGQIGEIKVKTPAQTATHPIRVSLSRDGLVTMTLYSAKEPGTVIYRLEKKEGVRPGESIVISGLISPQTDGGQRETYLQFTFERAPKEAAAPDEKEKSGAKKDEGKK